MIALKLTAMGTSTGAVIPKEMLTRLRMAQGDTLFAIETPSGYLLTPYDPKLEEQLRTGREIMDEYREVLHALAGKRPTLAERLAMCDTAAEPNQDAVYWANRPPVGRELL